jgi:hypothetical protein
MAAPATPKNYTSLTDVTEVSHPGACVEHHKSAVTTLLRRCAEPFRTLPFLLRPQLYLGCPDSALLPWTSGPTRTRGLLLKALSLLKFQSW